MGSFARDILLDGAAGYDSYTISLNLPSTLFGTLGTMARGLLLMDTPLPLPAHGVHPIDLLPVEWDDGDRKMFDRLPIEDKLTLVGGYTAIIHESLHHLDLLRTPFGASVHEKLCREYCH